MQIQVDFTHKGLDHQFGDVATSISHEISMYQGFACPIAATCHGDCSNCDISNITMKNRRLN